MTEAEYLAFERAAETKHEFFGGEVFDMAGASFKHNVIVGNLIAALGGQLRGRSCVVTPSDLRLHVPGLASFTYPDVMVICGEPRFFDDRSDTLLNPTIIIEVLSSSTEANDRGAKFQVYRAIDSLREYLLVSQNTPRIERFVRRPNDPIWELHDAYGLDAALTLDAITCTLSLTDVYANVTDLS